MPLWQVLTLATVLALSLGSVWRSGEFSPKTIVAVLAAVPLAAAALVSARLWGQRKIPELAWDAAVAALAMLNLAPGVVPHNSLAAVAMSVLLALAAVALASRAEGRLRWAAFGVAIAANLVLAASRITWGSAQIDVFGLVQGAAKQLLQGHNPYAAVYPSTTPGVALFHFAYGPVVPLLSAPARLLGDIRVANAAALVLIYFCIAALAIRTQPAREAGRYMALAVALPFGPFMVAQAWPEIYPVAGVALWLVLRDRRRGWATLVLGLGLATVPTAVPVLALPWLWWRRARIEITAAALVAIAVSLPFALWAGLGNFFAATVLVQLRIPTRVDALSINALLVHLGRGFLPAWAGFAVSALCLIAFWRWPWRDWASAFLLGATLTLVAFLTAKWAFFDYYFIVVYGFALGLALARPEPGESPGTDPTKVGSDAQSALSAGAHQPGPRDPAGAR